ncbi:MAG: hypothetical protein SGI96_03255 [Bacteroidota bacterium]|nr:hypothetical protein [Saprospiraceae bacterium]MDZ4807265.1 hypothetical protein [Bacteroidota bacterium]
MNSIKYLFFLISLMSCVTMLAQNESSMFSNQPSTVPKLTIEPGIGIHTNFGTDFLITNLIQWNPINHLSIASHSSFNINNITQRYFNGIKTNYNFSINQKFGIGTTIYTKRRSHTFLLMTGAKYTTFRETLDDERFDKVSSSIRALSPDYGLMYSQKKIWKKYFFTYRMYVPLYPWPTKGAGDA